MLYIYFIGFTTKHMGFIVKGHQSPYVSKYVSTAVQVDKVFIIKDCIGILLQTSSH